MSACKDSFTDMDMKNCPIAEIVFCKDCKHYFTEETETPVCVHPCHCGHMTNENDYCSDAERRE